MSKWDDDDVERPAVPPTKRGDPSAALDWQAQVNAAGKAAREHDPAERPKVDGPPRDVILDERPQMPPPAPPPSDDEQAELSAAARASARDVHMRARGKKTVRLRTAVNGWYPGSVPAVDHNDGVHHYFPRAPRHSCADEGQYLTYWRAPFVDELKRLGLTVIEDDV